MEIGCCSCTPILYVAVVVYIYTDYQSSSNHANSWKKGISNNNKKVWYIVPLARGEYSVVGEYFNVILPLIPNLCDGKNL